MGNGLRKKTKRALRTKSRRCPKCGRAINSQRKRCKLCHSPTPNMA